MLGFLERYRELGFLLLRVGIGAAFVVHGWAKVAGGEKRLIQVGSAMKELGVHFAPLFWGVMAAGTEIIGGVLFAVGLFFRPATALLLFTMIVATATNLDEGFPGYSHPLKMAILFAGMLLIGPGKYVIKRD